MEIIKQLVIDNEIEGYEVEYDDGATGTFTKKGLYCLIEELKESGYKFLGFDNQILDPQGNSISDLPEVSWDEENFEIQDLKDSVEWLEEQVEFSELSGFLEKESAQNMTNDLQTFRLDEPASVKIKTKEELIAHVQASDAYRNSFGISLLHIPTNWYSSQSSLFKIEDIINGYQANAALTNELLKSEEAQTMGPETRAQLLAQIREFDLFKQSVKFLNFGSVVEVISLVRYFKEKGFMKSSEIDNIRESDLVNAITKFGIPSINFGDKVVGTSMLTNPMDSINVSNDLVSFQSRSRTVQVLVDKFAKISSLKIDTDYQDAMLTGPGSELEIYDSVKTSINKKMGEVINKGNRYLISSGAELANAPRYEVSFMYDDQVCVCAYTLNRIIAYVKWNKEVLFDIPITADCKVSGIGTTDIRNVFNQREVVVSFAAKTLAEGYSKSMTKIPPFEDSISLLTKVGYWAGSALSISRYLMIYNPAFKTENTKSLGNLYGLTPDLVDNFKGGLKRLLMTGDKIDESIYNYLQEFVTQEDEECLPGEQLIRVVTRANEAFQASQEGMFADKTSLVNSKKTFNDLIFSATPETPVEDLWEQSDFLKSVLFVSDFLSGSISTGSLGEGLYQDASVNLDSFVGALKVYLMARNRQKATIKEFISSVVKDVEEFSGSNSVHNLGDFISERNKAFLGCYEDTFELKSKAARARYLFHVNAIWKEFSNKPLKERRDYGVTGKIIPLEGGAIQNMVDRVRNYVELELRNDKPTFFNKEGEAYEFDLDQMQRRRILQMVDQNSISLMLAVGQANINFDQLRLAMLSGEDTTSITLLNETPLNVKESGEFFVKFEIPELDGKYYLDIEINTGELQTLTAQIFQSPEIFCTLHDLCERQFNPDGTADIHIANATITPWSVTPKRGTSIKAYNLLCGIFGKETVARTQGMDLDQFDREFEWSELCPNNINLVEAQQHAGLVHEYGEDAEIVKASYYEGWEQDNPNMFLKHNIDEDVMMYFNRWVANKKFDPDVVTIPSKSDLVYETFGHLYKDFFMQSPVSGAGENKDMWKTDILPIEISGTDVKPSKLIVGTVGSNYKTVGTGDVPEFLEAIITDYISLYNDKGFEAKEKACTELCKKLGLDDVSGETAYNIVQSLVLSGSDVEENFELLKQCGKVITKDNVGVIIKNTGSFLERK